MDNRPQRPSVRRRLDFSDEAMEEYTRANPALQTHAEITRLVDIHLAELASRLVIKKSGTGH